MMSEANGSCELCAKNPIPIADYPSAQAAHKLAICGSCYKRLTAAEKNARRQAKGLPITKGRKHTTRKLGNKKRGVHESDLFAAIDSICGSLELLAAGVEAISLTVATSAENAEDILAQLRGGMNDFEKKRKEASSRMIAAEEKLRKATEKLRGSIPEDAPSNAPMKARG